MRAAGRSLRGLFGAGLGVIIPVAAAGGSAAYFARWERTTLVVIAVCGGFAFGYNLNIAGKDLISTLRGPTVAAALVFPPEIAMIVLAVQSDVRPGRFAFLRFDVPGMRVVGLLLVAVAAVVQVWAERTLGRQYIGQVGILQGHELIRRGPYKLVRHPAYGAELFSDVGGGLALGSWIGIPCALLIFAVLACRATREDRLLAEAFGEQARDMQHHTWRLVPGVY